jgi:hypothetical protein
VKVQGEVMRRPTYLGGGTIVRLSNDGTSWETPDAAERQRAGGKRRPAAPTDRRPTTREIEAEERREAFQVAIERKDQQKQIRSFVSQCALAYSRNRLTRTFPCAPDPLRKLIQTAGGNVSWLEADPSLRTVFYDAYCKFVGRRLAFEKVWGPPRTRR